MVIFGILLLLLFRNTRLFTHPIPWGEDFAIFIYDEYNIGFPNTALMLYAGYIHLLPRIIAFLSMKFDISSAMIVMNWSVLLIKTMIFYLVFRSKEIKSNLIKFSLLTYLILLPLCDEIYNNVTGLQWWLIPLMALIIVKRDTDVFQLSFDIFVLILTGLTGINSVLFAVPCIFLMVRVRTKDCFIKCVIVILCAFIQYYCLNKSGRTATGDVIMYKGGVLEVINLFVNRIMYATLFDISSTNYINVAFFLAYMLMLVLNLVYYRKQVAVQFIFLFALIYTALIFFNFMKICQNFSGIMSSLHGLNNEHYFAFLRICSFVLLVSSLDIVFRLLFSDKKYRRLMAYSCFLLFLFVVKNYPVYFLFNDQYYTDIAKFELAQTGEVVKFTYAPPGWATELTKK